MGENVSDLTKIGIGIPCYNCERQIVRVLESLLRPKNFLLFDHLFVVDNRSLDNTVLVVQQFLEKNPELSSKTSLLLNNKNYGLGGTHKIIFQAANKKGLNSVVILHGDDQAEADDITHLISKIKSDNRLVAALGSRFSWSSERQGYSLVRTLGNIGLNVVYSVLKRRWIVDLGSGINLFRIDRLPLERVLSLTDGFTFNMELLILMIELKLKFTFVPIKWSEYDQVSNARNVSVGWRALKVAVKSLFDSVGGHAQYVSYESTEVSLKKNLQ